MPNPKCDPKTEEIEEYQMPVNGTACSCTLKKCVAGLISIKFLFKYMSRCKYIIRIEIKRKQFVLCYYSSAFSFWKKLILCLVAVATNIAYIW